LLDFYKVFARLATLLILSGTTGLLLNAYQPVSGNWCWLEPSPIYTRYVLGHGWRLLIILITIALYIHLFIYIHRHFASLRQISTFDTGYSETAVQRTDQLSITATQDEHIGIFIHNDFEIYEERTELPWDIESPVREKSCYNFPRVDNKELTDQPPIIRPVSPYNVINQIIYPDPSENSETSASSHRRNSQVSLLSRDPLALVLRPPPLNNITTTITPPNPPPATFTEREVHIQKLLLLNAYPIGYIILWLPGILNRFVELGGHTNKALQIAQASTQFVGLANACKSIVLVILGCPGRGF
jgi:hypothetical protein